MSNGYLGGVLPIDELIQILRSENRRDFVIGGKVIPERAELVLYRGNLEAVTVPLAQFTSGLAGATPDPTRFAVINYGQTICLGEYEASADAILCEFDKRHGSEKCRGGSHE